MLIVNVSSVIEAGNAIGQFLLEELNPSGHLTDTWEKVINDYPTKSTFLESPLILNIKKIICRI